MFKTFAGRDHGLGTYLEVRKQCGLRCDFKSFDDLRSIFPKSYVELLEAEYDSVKDIDLVVGGSLESFQNLDKDLVGETFDCIIRDQFKRVVAGDVYFFTNPSSPYPFSAEQITTIKKFSFNQLVCANTGVESVPGKSFYVGNESNNAKVNCCDFAPINLDAWKDI